MASVLTHAKENAVVKQSAADRVRAAAAAPDDLITTIAAAVLVDVSPKTIRRRVADGSLPAYRVGPRLVRVSQADVLALARPIPTAGDAA